MRVIAGLMLLAILSLSSCVPGPGAESPVPETGRPDQQEEGILLPAPRLSSERSLEETLSRRRSVRRFTDEELTTQDISQLLWAAQGITREWGGRTAPSAGALYPLEIYVAMPQGFYHYEPQGHKIELIMPQRCSSSRRSTSVRRPSMATARPATCTWRLAMPPRTSCCKP